MSRTWIFFTTLFTLPFLAVAGKWITDALTTNNTFVGFALAANLTNYAWIPAFTMSIWWFIPIVIVVAMILKIMKKDEPQYPAMPTMRIPKQPKPAKAPKLKKGQKPVASTQPPSIFLGGR